MGMGMGMRMGVGMGVGMGVAAHRHGLSSTHQLRDGSRQPVRAKLDRLQPMDRWLRACAVGAADALCAGIGRDAHAPGGRTTADHVRPAGRRVGTARPPSAFRFLCCSVQRAA